jgi:hypothetical protein
MFIAFNLLEAAMWLVLGTIVAVRARLAVPRLRRVGFVAASALIAFAGTDIVEARTGAWFRPWWLLVYNGLCIAVLLGCYVAYRFVREVPANRDAV